MTRRVTSRARDLRRRELLAGVLAALAMAAAFYVSFSAIRGLPWESRYEISVELPTTSRLVVNDTVRVHGVRVGRVASVAARPATAARPAHALIGLSLDGSMRDLPADTTARARAASVLGASYLELVPGRSRRHLAAHATLPLRRAAGPVELTDLFSLFDGSARRNIRGLLGELGPGLAGRGPALSDTVAGLGRIVGPLTAVSRTLAAPRTRLADSITSYAVFTEAITPVAGDLAGVVDDAATTFGALASERRPLHAALGEIPRTETAVTRALVRLRPALNDLSAVATDLRPASRVLPSTLASTNRALHDGVPAARGLPAFATRLGSTLRAVATFARRTVTGQAVRRLSDLVVALRPTVEILESAQRSCNLIPPMLQDVSQLASFPLVGRDPKNPPLYAALLQISHLGAQGEVFQQAAPSPNVAINYLPHENEHECESGNELHDGVSQVLSNPPGNQPTTHPSSEPPVDATRRAQAAGLLDRPEGWRP